MQSRSTIPVMLNVMTDPERSIKIQNRNRRKRQYMQAKTLLSEVYTIDISVLVSDCALHNITPFPTFSSAPKCSHIGYAGETAIHVSLCRGVDCLERVYVWFGVVS